MKAFLSDPGVLATTAAAVAAWIAALVAYRSYRLAKQQVALVAAAERRKEPLLSPSLIDSLFTVVSEVGRLYAFSVSISNNSDSPNSLSRVELKILIAAADAPPHVLMIPHEASLSDHFGPGVTTIQVPTNLGPQSTVAGWFLFQVPASLLSSGQINGYHVAMTDAHGHVETISTMLLKEENDEARLAKRMGPATTSKTSRTDRDRP